jgi:hypothetical protein
MTSLTYGKQIHGIAVQERNLGELLTETFSTLKRCAILRQSLRIVKEYFLFLTQII